MSVVVLWYSTKAMMERYGYMQIEILHRGLDCNSFPVTQTRLRTELHRGPDRLISRPIFDPNQLVQHVVPVQRRELDNREQQLGRQR